MKPVKQWFSLGPYDEYEGREHHWYNYVYEFHGTRIRLMAGDLLASCEDENGGHIGPQFTLELHFAQEDIPEFYLPDAPRAKYDIHYLTILFWRWGIYLSVRGRVKAAS